MIVILGNVIWIVGYISAIIMLSLGIYIPWTESYDDHGTDGNLWRAFVGAGGLTILCSAVLLTMSVIELITM